MLGYLSKEIVNFNATQREGMCASLSDKDIWKSIYEKKYQSSSYKKRLRLEWPFFHLLTYLFLMTLSYKVFWLLYFIIILLIRWVPRPAGRKRKSWPKSRRRSEWSSWSTRRSASSWRGSRLRSTLRWLRIWGRSARATLPSARRPTRARSAWSPSAMEGNWEATSREPTKTTDLISLFVIVVRSKDKITDDCSRWFDAFSSWGLVQKSFAFPVLAVNSTHEKFGPIVHVASIYAVRCWARG